MEHYSNYSEIDVPPELIEVNKLYGTRYLEGMRKVYLHHSSRHLMDSTRIDSVQADISPFPARNYNMKMKLYLPHDTTIFDLAATRFNGDTLTIYGSGPGGLLHITFILKYDTAMNTITSIYYDKWDEANPSPFLTYNLVQMK